jgi:hypothetical protein
MSEIESYDQAKQDFFKEFEKSRPDIVYAESWTPEQKKEASSMLRRGRSKVSMLSMIPLHCKGPDCIYAPTAPSIHESRPDYQKPCPVEAAAVHEFFWDYVDELGVDVARMVEVSMVRDLVDQEIQQLRKTIALSQEDFIQEHVVGLDAQGNVVTTKDLHKAIEYEDKILKRKEKIRNALLATRESKVKHGQAQADGATVIANILDEVRKVERAREKELMAKLGMAEYDAYIEDAEIEEDSPETEA